MMNKIRLSELRRSLQGNAETTETLRPGPLETLIGESGSGFAWASVG
jgi:hypothetical protein